MKIINQLELKKQVKILLKDLSKEDLKKAFGLKRLKTDEMTVPLDELMIIHLSSKYIKFYEVKTYWYYWNEIYLAKDRLFLSYKNFRKWLIRLGNIWEIIVEKQKSKLLCKLGFIDSTKLCLSEVKRFVKIMRKTKSPESIATQANSSPAKGHSSMGEFYGFKLHVLVDEEYNIAELELTPGNVHDINPVKNGLIDNCTGSMIFADKGYVSRDLRFKLMDKNINFLACPKANMGFSSDDDFNYCLLWDKKYKKLYRKRITVERLFAKLKRSYGLDIKGSKTFQSVKSRVFSSLAAYMLEKNGLILIDKII